MNSAAIDRILYRLAISRGGTAAAVEGGLTWEITLPEDPERDDGPTFSFRNTFTLEGGRVAEITCDTPMDRCSKVQAFLLAGVTREMAAALEREGVVFGAFSEVEAFLVREFSGKAEDGFVEISVDEDGPTVVVSDVRVAHEPWVNLSTSFVDEVDPEWLLETNGALTHLHFETFEGEVSLACAFPLALLTASRLVELVDDLFSFRENLLTELEEGEDEEEEG
jgi:hypothetical protein